MIKAAMLSTLRVKDVMTQAVLLVRAETPIDEAWRQLHDASVTGAPVLDARGVLVGVLSNHDLADPRHREPGRPLLVRDIMTRVVYAVRAEDSVVTAVRLMVDESIHRALVVNDDGSLAGIVVPMDILKVIAQHDEPHVEYFDLRRLRVH
jgi:CBS-domain-containing membrane protein